MNSEAAFKVLLLGEYDVGKTHYGAQLLGRLRVGSGRLRMRGAAGNLTAFETALENLNEGRLAPHSVTGFHASSHWPVLDDAGRALDLFWPDYAGEQVQRMIDDRIIPQQWLSNLQSSDAWVLMLRLERMQSREDVFTRPLAALQGGVKVEMFEVSAEARLIELLQLLAFAAGRGLMTPICHPSLTVLLSCWDEIRGIDEGTAPGELLKRRLPLFSQFIESNWHHSSRQVYGLSALGQPLEEKGANIGFVTEGPEAFGYVVLPDASKSPDLTIPISSLIKRVGA